MRYEAGESMSRLAEMYGYSCTGSIGRVLRRHGVQTRRRGARYAEIDKGLGEEIVVRFGTGESATAIAKDLPISFGNVCRYLKARGMSPNRGHPTGENHHAWKGGRCTTAYGYVVVRMEPNSPYWSMAHSNGYVMEHRLVMAKALGRSLQKWETIHHINGDKADNCIENLQLRVGKHGNGVVYVCGDCGSSNIVPQPLCVS